MILVDKRIGSKELFKYFPLGSARLTHLEYGDFSFVGNGREGTVLVGVERKRLGDLVSSMCTGRLSGRQLIGMLNVFHHSYIIVEGTFRPNPESGLLEVYRYGGWYPYRQGKRQFMAKDIWAFLTTMESICGVCWHHCTTQSDTVHFIRGLYKWWNKPYDRHKSYLQATQSPMVELTRQPVMMRVLAQLDGIGFEKAQAISLRYASVHELMRAPRAELRTIEGIGEKLAQAIHEQLGINPLTKKGASAMK